ncbi:MAG: hypothetical protein VXV91_01890, partial [Verrucomicrobiota bacterium]|nr:hypothetical protein [Verrucomicrobiota bacterium]
MLQQTDYLCGEEVPEYDTTPLAKAPPLGSRGGPEIAREPRILSEMSPATIKSKVRSILQASMRQEGRASLVPDPSSIVFGLDEALAQDERSKADDQTAAHHDAELRKTGTKRMRYDDWLESYAQELDDEKRAADARKAELEGLQADVDKSEIATKLGFGVSELNYIAPTGRDWKNLYVVASKEFRVDPAGEFEDLRTPHGAAKFWRFPAVNQVQTTLAQEKRVASGGLPFEGPAQADIGGTRTLLSEVWSRFDEYLLAVRDYDADMRDVHEAQRRGHGPPAPRRPDPFLSTAEDFDHWMKGHTFEVFQGPGEQLFVRRVDDADADEPGNGSTINIDYLEETLGPHFPNKSILFELRHGIRLKSDIPWSVCIFPPQRSAKDYMAQVATGVREELDRGWLQTSTHLPGVPYQAEQYGTATKKGSMKRRRTTGKSPHKSDERVKRRALSVNQNIDLERDFPECNLTKVTEIREAAEIIRAIWMHIVQSRKDANRDDTLEGFLQPCAVLADLESYFRQFVMCTVDRLRLQGMYIKLSEDEISKFVTDGRLQFGGRPGPVVGTQVADIVIHIWRMKMDEFEQAVEKDATMRMPHPTAEKLCPPELRACLRDRARVDPKNKDSQRPSWCHQFIDDFTAICLGKLRALKAILIYFEVCESIGLPVSLQKTEIGTHFTNLGLDFYLREGSMRIPRAKLRLYSRWMKRIRGMYKSIEHKELESIVGTFGFGSVCVSKAKPLLSRCFAAIHSKIGRRGQYSLLTQTCKNDLNAINQEFIKNIGVPFADPELLFLNPSSMLHYMWSDASRSKSKEDFSGMGGFCLLTGIAWYWEFSDKEREGMQIHITEMVASLVNILISRHELRNSRLVELVDNEGVVHVQFSARTTDPRMKLLNL